MEMKEIHFPLSLNRDEKKKRKKKRRKKGMEIENGMKPLHKFAKKK